jgi:hypothetical protein
MTLRNSSIRDLSSEQEIWPELSLNEWKDTYSYLHMISQIIGKIRLRQMPHINHWWQVTLYITAKGLTTTPIPYGNSAFEIQFDFIEHQLVIYTIDGATKSIPFHTSSVTEMYNKIMTSLKEINIEIQIWPIPVEVEKPLPFLQNRSLLTYNSKYANNFWRILVQTARVFQQFRSNFIGKCSPIHFFWGSFDLALTRFSGRRAPEHPPVPNNKHSVVTEAYSHEVSSCGFWPGGAGPIQEPVFYSYTYPEPQEYKSYPVQPSQAYYNQDMGEFILPYDSIRNATNSDKNLLAFLHSTYDAAAITGHWDRNNLER